ncbi:MAG TPA: outer membrane lipoprotein-sorting protein [Candidatus Marinimicrobia bacterium]|nr:outer membrane lipoprotein-sorting protein [Candidatus Neomarinimicrobiota bacterium]
MRIFRSIIILLALFQVLWAMTGQEIMDKMEARDTGKTMHAIMKMTLIDKNGESRERIIEIWAMIYDEDKNLNQSVMEFKSPATVKGTRFLQIEQDGRNDDQWIFLPALGRVRRIAASEGNASFMGSDFSYDDMKLQSGHEGKREHDLLRDEKIGKHECYVVESRSKNGDDSQYSKLISWITKEHFIPVRVEFYDKSDGKLLKVLTIDENIEKVDGIWTVFNTQMENVRESHRTRLTTLRNAEGLPFIEYNKAIDPRRFTQNFLQTGQTK